MGEVLAVGGAQRGLVEALAHTRTDHAHLVGTRLQVHRLLLHYPASAGAVSSKPVAAAHKVRRRRGTDEKERGTEWMHTYK